MDDLLDGHSCLFSHETHEHTYFLYNQTTPYVMNSIITCRPQHPFMRELFKALPTSAHKHKVLESTGPIFVSRVFSQYKETNRHSKEDSVSVIHPKYLLPTFDKIKKHTLIANCLLPQKGERKALCDWQRKDCWRNKPQNVSYTNHHWFHAYYQSPMWFQYNTINIKDMMRN